jgi:hypothetical protein
MCVKCGVKNPSFNYENIKNAEYCKDCKYENMVDKTHPNCIKCNNKKATFNFKNKKKPEYCADCKSDDMIDINNKKCYICKIKIPIFNLPNEKYGKYCKDCKSDEMVDKKHKNCIKCNIKRPFWNLPNENIPLYCKNCKSSNMIDVVTSKCIKCKITRSAFNFPNEKKGLYCKNCSVIGMINFRDKKCIFEGCKKQPTFNYPNEKKRLYCGSHYKDGMVDIKNDKCILCKIIYAGKNYKKYCFNCYCFTFPEDIIVRNHKTKENQIMSDLLKIYDNIIRDKTIFEGCSKRRPDGLIKLNDYNIIIEIDENQHLSNSYSCENKRLMEIFNDLGNSPLTIIRFNPDKYNNIKGLFSITKSTGQLKITNQKKYNERLNILIETIKEQINQIPNKDINIIKLFYNIGINQ